MALTRTFKETVLNRVQRDPDFRKALLAEALSEFLSGNLEVAKSVIRNYINAALSFQLLAERLHKNDKSLQRMLGPKGNPTTSHFCELLGAIQQMEGVKFEVRIR